MRRIVMFLLALTAIVAAQTPAESSAQQKKINVGDQKTPMYMAEQNRSRIDTKDSSTRELQEKLQTAVNDAKDAAESAQHAAVEFRAELNGRTSADSLKLLVQRKALVQERLQEAIAALDKASTKVNAQIDQVRDRIQTRLQEKKAELIKIQEKLRAKK